MTTQTLAEPATLIEPRKITAAEFLQMHQVGIFADTERLELLQGKVSVMTPIDPLHGGTVNRLTKLLMGLAGDKALLSVQNPILLDEHNQPQPDFALLVPRDDDYTKSHAQPHEVLLLIEVSQTSLEYDRRLKLPLYAAAGVPEMWIVDLNKQQIEQFTQPHEQQYKLHTIVVRGDKIAATQVSGISFTTDQLFA